MRKEHTISKNIRLASLVFLSAFFLSGCYGDQPREQALQNADQYNIKSYEERQVDSSPAAHRLSVGVVPQQTAAENQAASGNPAGETKEPPAMQINQSKNYSAILKTGEGDITIELDAKKVPITVNNFIALARQNFYGGTIFHRVIKDFMIQGGDPKGDGSGGPGYKFGDENLGGELHGGTVAMANSGPDTNGSQFFIIHKDYDLPNKYVIFGRVSGGLEIVDKIASAEVMENGAGEKSKPASPVKIDSGEI